jgi:hypothetical protein
VAELLLSRLHCTRRSLPLHRHPSAVQRLVPHRLVPLALLSRGVTPWGVGPSCQQLPLLHLRWLAAVATRDPLLRPLSACLAAAGRSAAAEAPDEVRTPLLLLLMWKRRLPGAALRRTLHLGCLRTMKTLQLLLLLKEPWLLRLRQRKSHVQEGSRVAARGLRPSFHGAAARARLLARALEVQCLSMHHGRRKCDLKLGLLMSRSLCTTNLTK